MSHISDKQTYSVRFRRKNPDGSFTRGHGYWEDMAEAGSWGFVAQFLPDYERRDDVAASDDLACVLDNEKTLEWLYANYPAWDGLTMEELKKVRAQWDYELMQEAQAYLAAAVQSGEIEVCRLPVHIVSARIFGIGDSDCVNLVCADETLTHKGREFTVPSDKLQHVKSRWINEGEDNEQFQIYYESTNESGDAYWCNAQSIDFDTPKDDKHIWYCSECGSDDVEIRQWVKPNREDELAGNDSLDREDCWCNPCQEHNRLEICNTSEYPEILRKFTVNNSVQDEKEAEV